MPSPSSVLLKDIRRRLDLSQRAFGQKLGVTTRTVSRWELGTTEVPAATIPRALSLLRVRDPDTADRLGLDAGLPSAVAQDEARRQSLDSAVYLVADSLDVVPRRARQVLATFLTHLVAAGMTATDARSRLLARLEADAAAHEPIHATRSGTRVSTQQSPDKVDT